MIIDFLISKIEQLQFVDYEYMAVFLLLVFLVKKSLTGGVNLRKSLSCKIPVNF